MNTPPSELDAFSLLIERAADKRMFARQLLAWFDENQRELPWRTKKSLYRIWISEIMLQQTQVATVVDYFRRFIKSFPTVKKLAQADVSEVLMLWEGLGYYRRARQLHAAAVQIVENHGGKFPEEFSDVLALPGIGRYTAGAILSIAADQRQPILEGNTIRLYARLMGMKTDPKQSANQKLLWAFAESILPKKRCGDFNQALMELGSEYCRPRNPRCLLCPVSQFCLAKQRGEQESIPVSTKKMKYLAIREGVVLVKRQGKFLVRQCGPGERWEGLWDFPRFEIAKGDAATEQLARQLKELTALTANLRSTDVVIKHAVTKYRITLEVFESTDIAGRLKRQPTPTKWVSAVELASLPMSITGRKITNQLLVDSKRRRATK